MCRSPHDTWMEPESDAVSSLLECCLFCLLPPSRVSLVFISLANSGTCVVIPTGTEPENETEQIYIYSAIAEKCNRWEIVLRAARLSTRYEKINWPSAGPKLDSVVWLFYKKEHVGSLMFDVSNYFGASMLLFVEISLWTENWEWTSQSGKNMDVIWFYLYVPNELNLNNKVAKFNHFLI